MAKASAGKTTTNFQELVLFQTFQMAALLNVLERKGVLTQREVLAETTRLKDAAGKAR